MSHDGSILVVDDELGPRESLRMILKSNYQVYTAADGKEALQLIAKEKFDLITLDLNMPGIPGMEVLKEIRKIRTDTDIMIITGYGSSATTQEARSLGVEDFISKPFNISDILARVNKSFERRKCSFKKMSKMIN